VSVSLSPFIPHAPCSRAAAAALRPNGGSRYRAEGVRALRARVRACVCCVRACARACVACARARVRALRGRVRAWARVVLFPALLADQEHAPK
jgi:hypothetical protein